MNIILNGLTPENLSQMIAQAVRSEVTGLGEKPPSAEIINREELCKRLSLSEPTIIRWEKRGKIPAIRIGSNVRYNWLDVIKALENQK